MDFNLENIQEQIEAISKEQASELAVYEASRKLRINRIKDLVTAISIENVPDNDVYDTLDQINDALYDVRDSFQSKIYVHEHRNKLTVSVEDWQSSYC